MGYMLTMVQKLMESVDVNAALLACFSESDPITLTVQTKFGNVDEQLNSVEDSGPGGDRRGQSGRGWPPQSSGNDPEGPH